MADRSLEDQHVDHVLLRIKWTTVRLELLLCQQSLQELFEPAVATTQKAGACRNAF